MPNYDFFCSTCDFTVSDVQLMSAGRDIPTTEPCPKCEAYTIQRKIAAPGISYTAGTSLHRRTPDTFKDVLRNIKSKHRGSTINV